MTLDALANPGQLFRRRSSLADVQGVLQTSHDFLIGAAAGMTLDALANPGQLFRRRTENRWDRYLMPWPPAITFQSEKLSVIKSKKGGGIGAGFIAVPISPKYNP